MKSNFTKSIRVALSAFIVMFAALSLHAQFVEITAPPGVAGTYQCKPAWFQQEVTAVSGDFVLVDDGDDEGGAASTSDGCQALVNGMDVMGKIAIVDRGACSFVLKATNALDAGAVSVVICNNDTANPNSMPSMGGDDMDLINDNVVMMTFNQCETIKMGLAMGLTGGIVAPTAGETCLTAIDVAEGTHTRDSLTGGGGRNLFEFPDENYAAAWYTYTPGMDGLLTVSSCMGGADTRLVVGSGHCSLADINILAANDDFCDLGNGNAWASEVQLLVTGGTEYYIYFDDHWDASGFDFTVSLGAVPMVDVTVSVDMNEEGMDNGAHIAGEFNGWSSVPMTDNGDGTYSYTITDVTAGDTVEYLFQNGENVNWEGFPAFEDICTVTTPDGMFTNRLLVGGIADSQLPLVCFNSCLACPPPACTDPDAIFCDDLDSYTTGATTGGLAPHWTTWGGTWGGSDDGIVSDEQAASAPNSMLIAEAQAQDVLMLLGNQTAGNYYLKWDYYVPAGKSAYWNLQEDEMPGVAWNLEVSFGADNVGNPTTFGEGLVNQSSTTFTYAEDTWITFEHYIDLDNDQLSLYMDDVWISTIDYPGNLGSVNFFSINDDNRYYVDNILYKALPSCPDDAVICDSYESYADGSTTGGQNPWWGTWSGVFGTAEDGIVSSDQAFDGSNSMLIGDNGAQDVLLLLGNQTAGHWQVEMQMYVPTGNVGYFNIQEDEAPGVQWNLELWFNGSNANPSVLTPGMGQLSTGETFAMPQDAWFPVVNTIDLDNGTHTLTVDGNVVLDNVAYAGAQIGALDFFSIQAENTAYFDEIRFRELPPVQVPVNVTFHVNMAQQTTAGDGVFIAGTMNTWNGEAMNDDGDDTWSATYSFFEGDVVEYKFQNGAGGWEDDFPDAGCGQNNNRFFTVGASDTDLDLVCFNECADCMVNADDLVFANAISVFPNPAANVTNIQYTFEATTDLMIRMTNNLGQVISQDMLLNSLEGTHELNLNNLASGIYYIHITDGNRNMVEKLIVE